MKQEVVLSVKDKELVLCGDGRNDSPGYCAQYLTYSLMDAETKKLLTMQFIDCRETERKSPNMEKLGFTRAMDEIMSTCKVIEVVTDGHPQIKAHMSKYI